MSEAVPVSGRVRNLKVYGHVNTVSPFPSTVVYERNTHLNVPTAGADTEVVPLLYPGHGSDVLPWLLHLHELLDVTRVGIPQVNAATQTHCQQVVHRPVEQV